MAILVFIGYPYRVFLVQLNFFLATLYVEGSRMVKIKKAKLGKAIKSVFIIFKTFIPILNVLGIIRNIKYLFWRQLIISNSVQITINLSCIIIFTKIFIVLWKLNKNTSHSHQMHVKSKHTKTIRPVCI